MVLFCIINIQWPKENERENKTFQVRNLGQTDISSNKSEQKRPQRDVFHYWVEDDR